MKYLIGIVAFTVILIATGEVLDCVMFVNPYKTWCD